MESVQEGLGVLEKVCIRLNNSKLLMILEKVELVGVAWSRYRRGWEFWRKCALD